MVFKVPRQEAISEGMRFHSRKQSRKAETRREVHQIRWSRWERYRSSAACPLGEAAINICLDLSNLSVY